MSAAASIPCPVTSPSTIASRFSRGLQVVVDVAADADEGGRLVHRTDLQARHVRAEPGQQRPLHRVEERFLLLVEPRVVDCERGLGGDEQRGVEGLVRQGPARVERDDRQRREQLGRRGDRDDGRRRAALEEGDEQPVRVPELCRRPGIDAYRVPLHQAAACRRRDHVLGPLEDGQHRFFQLGPSDVHPLGEHVAALVWHPDHGDVDLEQLDDRGRDRVERLLEREAVRKRA